jgi:hypothetical protein
VNRSVIAAKFDQAQILNSASLVIGMWEDDCLRNICAWQQWDLIVRFGDGKQSIVGFFRLARDGCLFPHLVDGIGQFGPRKSITKVT